MYTNIPFLTKKEQKTLKLIKKGKITTSDQIDNDMLNNFLKYDLVESDCIYQDSEDSSTMTSNITIGRNYIEYHKILKDISFDKNFHIVVSLISLIISIIALLK